MHNFQRAFGLYFFSEQPLTMQSLVVNVTSDISTPLAAGNKKSPSRKSRKSPQHASSGTFATVVDNIIPRGDHIHAGMSPDDSKMTGIVENIIVSPANCLSSSKRCSLLRSVLVGNMKLGICIFNGFSHRHLFNFLLHTYPIVFATFP